MVEAIELCEQITGRELNWSYSEHNRTGDHIWWISDVGKFKGHYPGWRQRYDVPSILREIHDRNVELAVGEVMMIDGGKRNLLVSSSTWRITRPR